MEDNKKEEIKTPDTRPEENKPEENKAEETKPEEIKPQGNNKPKKNKQKKNKPQESKPKEAEAEAIKPEQKEIKKAEKGKKTARNIAIVVLVYALVACASFFVGRTYFETWPISGSSMEPNIHDGDRVLLVKTENYDYDDIIIFLSETSSSDAFSGRYLIKRVIGKAGDVMAIKYSTEDKVYHVYRNGEIVDESNIREGITKYYQEMSETVVPEGKIFILGDNRNNSHDSHYKNFYADENKVVGKVLLRYTSISDFNFL